MVHTLTTHARIGITRMRYTTVAAAAAGIIGAATTFAPIAHANKDPDAAYLRDILALGVKPNPGYGNNALIKGGHQMCSMMDDESPQQVSRELFESAVGGSPDIANVVVTYAIVDLCPEHVKEIPNSWYAPRRARPAGGQITRYLGITAHEQNRPGRLAGAAFCSPDESLDRCSPRRR